MSFGPATIIAPFSDEVVKALKRFQKGGMHPYTCNKSKRHSGESVKLVPTNDGWICGDPGCDYTQNWATKASTEGLHLYTQRPWEER